MSVQFAAGQEVRLHMPGGVFRAFVQGPGAGDKEWILVVPDENPVRRVNGRNADEFDE